MKEIRLATKIIQTLVKDRMQYPGRLIADTGAMIARCGLLLFLYSYVYKLNGGTINGTGFVVTAWSIFFYFCFSVLRLRDISKAIMQDVQTGNIETLFSKPISYLAYRSWWQIGSGLYSFIVSALLGGVLLFLIIGIPSTMSTGFFAATLVGALIGACTLCLILYSVIGMLAFWIEDINPVFWVVDKTVMILGGSYLPVALFPSFMYKLALYTPFGAAQLVTRTVYETWKTEWALSFGVQVFWIAVLGVLLYFMFAWARQKVSVNGG
jgi:ABC-2 type transport system permease protein